MCNPPRADERDRFTRLRPHIRPATFQTWRELFAARLARSVRQTMNPNMPSHSDQSGRPVTPCGKCRTADVRAVAHASNFVFLRCSACRFLFVIENRRSSVRSEHRGGIFRRALRGL